MAASPAPIHLLILYYSRFGALKALAEQIATGVRCVECVEGAEMEHLEVEGRYLRTAPAGAEAQGITTDRAAAVARIAAADALIVGSPAHFGTMAAPVKRFFEECVTEPPDQSRTPGMFVVTLGQRMPTLENDLAPYGATVVTGARGTRPMTEQERAAQGFGEHVAKVALRLTLGRAGVGIGRTEGHPYPPFYR